MKKLTCCLLYFITVLFFSCTHSNHEGKMMKTELKPDSGCAEINGVKLYYEIYGQGEPLLYLHGGISSGKDFREYIPDLSKKFQVITVDRRGHGRSFDNGEPYSYAAMGDEMNAFMDYMKIDSAYVMGWSDGGVVGFHLAGKYPERVRKLIAVGANYLVTGMTPGMIEWIETQMTAEGVAASIPGIKRDYLANNPQPENYASFISRSRDMWLREPYMEREDFINIGVPVLLVAGDKDDVTLEHMAEMYSLLENAQLCILPDTDHFVFAQRDETVLQVIYKFLNTKMEK
ncbi:MAG TPA: alpha/beta hydrolase [bacterium]|nr:alpha/beta hydrolase [bacterium]HPN43988.1 alpha/beta hydrolase [bacterium]